ncbi:hypothetical protein CKA32_001436 [Geitlerinema sp. FC II]|nr:hypothetical protein CKA32_001436 [Geitlerinema sp. FC II]
MVNFNARNMLARLANFVVSIPQRDFGEFQHCSPLRSRSSRSVSIPQRDFGEFQLQQKL